MEKEVIEDIYRCIGRLETKLDLIRTEHDRIVYDIDTLHRIVDRKEDKHACKNDTTD